MSDGTGLNGSYGTHVVLRAGTHVVRIPKHVPDAVAAPANCALATVCNTLEAAELPHRGPRKTAIVQGAGLLGMYAIAWLKYELDFEHVWCIDRNPYRIPLTAKFGATPHHAIDTAEERIAMINKVAPNGVDVVVEMTGSAAVVPEGIKFLRYGGHYAFAGMVHPNSKLDAISGEDIIRRCITIRGSHNYAPAHLEQAVKFLADHTAGGPPVAPGDKHRQVLPFDTLVSPPYPLSDLATAMVEAQKHTWTRVSINFP